MATAPDQPQRSGYGGGGGMGGMDMSRLPIPGNAELVVFLIVWLIIAIIWAASDTVGANDFVTATVFLTVGYLLSRGIAKASRVHETSATPGPGRI